MQCPNHDSELASHSAQGENNLTISYATCPNCHGYWMDSFAANFIKLPPFEITSVQSSAATSFFCPICQKSLVQSSGNNIPDTVRVYECPDHHGYFFPTGQLAAFKMAQQAKISYHKLWGIPMPSVASVLLGGLVVLVLTGGFIATYANLQQKQTTTSQAQQLLTNQKVFVSPGTHAALFSAQTSVDAALTVTVPEFNNFTAPMATDDHKNHRYFLNNIPPGTYTYFLKITVAGKETTSSPASFVVF